MRIFSTRIIKIIPHIWQELINNEKIKVSRAPKPKFDFELCSNLAFLKMEKIVCGTLICFNTEATNK